MAARPHPWPAGAADSGGLGSLAGNGKPGKGQTTATVQIDPEAKRPLRISYLLPINSNLGHGKLQAEVEYGATASGRWLPTRILIDQSGRYLFWSRRLVIRQELLDWTERAAEVK